MFSTNANRVTKGQGYVERTNAMGTRWVLALRCGLKLIPRPPRFLSAFWREVREAGRCREGVKES